ncbi:hypothetical protein R1flu_023565 [Riccia fluitans]|uniref:Uncharacterized protein n=1 Tax=Riccia fluitans TaxID=41844 RepID=A0ABD1XSE0_9MARC
MKSNAGEEACGPSPRTLPPPVSKLRRERALSEIFEQLANRKNVVLPVEDSPIETEHVSNSAQGGVTSESQNRKDDVAVGTSAHKKRTTNEVRISSITNVVTAAANARNEVRHGQNPAAHEGLNLDFPSCEEDEAVETSAWARCWRERKKNGGESCTIISKINADQSLIIELNPEFELRGNNGQEQTEVEKKLSDPSFAPESTEDETSPSERENSEALPHVPERVERDVSQYRSYSPSISEGSSDFVSQNHTERDCLASASSSDSDYHVLSSVVIKPIQELWRELREEMLLQGTESLSSPRRESEACGKHVTGVGPRDASQAGGVRRERRLRGSRVNPVTGQTSRSKLRRAYASHVRPGAGKTSRSKRLGRKRRHEEFQAGSADASGLRFNNNEEASWVASKEAGEGLPLVSSSAVNTSPVVAEHMREKEREVGEARTLWNPTNLAEVHVSAVHVQKPSTDEGKVAYALGQCGDLDKHLYESSRVNETPLSTIVGEGNFAGFDLNKLARKSTSEPAERKVRFIDLNETPPVDDSADLVRVTRGGRGERELEAERCLGVQIDSTGQTSRSVRRKSLEMQETSSHEKKSVERNRMGSLADCEKVFDVDIVKDSVRGGSAVSWGNAKIENSISANLKTNGVSVKKKLKAEAREPRQSSIRRDVVSTASLVAKTSETQAVRKDTILETRKGSISSSESEKNSQIDKQFDCAEEDSKSSFSDDSDELHMSVLFMRRRQIRKSREPEGRKSDEIRSKKKNPTKSSIHPSPSYGDVYWYANTSSS